MINPDLEINPRTILPKKCWDCAVQCGRLVELAVLFNDKRYVTALGEDVIGEGGEVFDRMVDRHFPVDEAEQKKREQYSVHPRNTNRVIGR